MLGVRVFVRFSAHNSIDVRPVRDLSSFPVERIHEFFTIGLCNWAGFTGTYPLFSRVSDKSSESDRAHDGLSPIANKYRPAVTGNCKNRNSRVILRE